MPSDAVELGYGHEYRQDRWRNNAHANSPPRLYPQLVQLLRQMHRYFVELQLLQ